MTDTPPTAEVVNEEEDKEEGKDSFSSLVDRDPKIAFVVGEITGVLAAIRQLRKPEDVSHCVLRKSHLYRHLQDSPMRVVGEVVQYVAEVMDEKVECKIGTENGKVIYRFFIEDKK